MSRSQKLMTENSIDKHTNYKGRQDPKKLKDALNSKNIFNDSLEWRKKVRLAKSDNFPLEIRSNRNQNSSNRNPTETPEDSKGREESNPKEKKTLNSIEGHEEDNQRAPIKKNKYRLTSKTPPTIFKLAPRRKITFSQMLQLNLDQKSTSVDPHCFPSSSSKLPSSGSVCNFNTNSVLYRPKEPNSSNNASLGPQKHPEERFNPQKISDMTPRRSKTDPSQEKPVFADPKHGIRKYELRPQMSLNPQALEISLQRKRQSLFIKQKSSHYRKSDTEVQGGLKKLDGKVKERIISLFKGKRTLSLEELINNYEKTFKAKLRVNDLKTFGKAIGSIPDIIPSMGMSTFTFIGGIEFETAPREVGRFMKKNTPEVIEPITFSMKIEGDENLTKENSRFDCENEGLGGNEEKSKRIQEFKDPKKEFFLKISGKADPGPETTKSDESRQLFLSSYLDVTYPQPDSECFESNKSICLDQFPVTFLKKSSSWEGLDPVPRDFRKGIDLGSLMEKALYPHNSFFLLSFVSRCRKDEFALIAEETRKSFPLLACDYSAGRFCMKLFQLCNSKQMGSIIEVVKGSIHELSCNQNASTVLQKMASCVFSDENRYLFVSGITNAQHVLMMIQSESAIFVLFAFFEHFPFRNTFFLVKIGIDYFYTLSKISAGVHFLKKCLAVCLKGNEGGSRLRASNELQMKRLMYSNIVDQAVKYSRDIILHSNGRFLLQKILEIGIQDDIRRIHQQLRGNYCSYAKNKSAAFVVEGLLTKSNWQERAEIVNELVDDPEFGLLLNDSYGNFVLQKVLGFCLRTQIPKVLATLEPYLKHMDSKMKRKWSCILEDVKSRMEVRDKYISAFFPARGDV